LQEPPNMIDIIMHLILSTLASLLGAVSNVNTLQGVFLSVTKIFCSQGNWIAVVISVLFGTASLATVANNLLRPAAAANNPHRVGGGMINMLTGYSRIVLVFALLFWLCWPVTISFMAALSGARIYLFGLPQKSVFGSSFLLS